VLPGATRPWPRQRPSGSPTPNGASGWAPMVSLRPGADVDADAIRAWGVGNDWGSLKAAPAALVVSTELPSTATGKVLRREVAGPRS